MSYTPEQRAIIALSKRLSRGYGPRIRKALLEAEAVESSFRNLNYGDRDSQGVLQQRPSTGWGPPGNAAQDIRQFLDRAQSVVRSGFRGTAGQLAQAVQRSAFPGRYDQHRAEATALLGGAGPSGAASVPPMVAGPAPATGQQRSAFARALTNPAVAHDPLRLLQAIRAVEAPVKSPDAAAPGGDKGAVTGRGGGFKLSNNGSTLSQLEPLAHQFGLKITSTTGGKHVPNSYHYQGRAVDFSGDPAREMSLMHYALAHPHQFKEAFFDPAGYYVKDGRVYRGAIGGHNDHVHLAR